MIVKQKFLLMLRNVLLTTVMLFALFNCSEEEILAPAAEVTPDASVVEESAPAEETLAFSLTISGAHTTFSNAADCSTCTFVVPANTFIVDGKDFKPGDVICLDAAVKYGQLEFVNMLGSPEKPIVISNCGASAAAEQNIASTTEEPY